jgi:hypothetical protein
MRIAKRNRERIISDLVKDGDSWAKARRYYELTLGMQMRAVGMMANWLGGDFIHRDKKGDKNGRAPIEPVPAKQQRDALVCTGNAFEDQACRPDTGAAHPHGRGKWWDDSSTCGFHSPVHDQIMGLQAYTLTMLMNPDTLQRIYDTELIAKRTDVATLRSCLKRSNRPSDGAGSAAAKHDARNPMISSLRRNLQREHLERLIDLSRSDSMSSAVYKPISTLVVEQLRQLKAKIDSVLDTHKDSLDPYSQAHVRDAGVQIQKALDAHYVYQSL